MTELDRSHDPAARSWVRAAGQGAFPIQNLPLGAVRRRGTGERFRIATAIGEEVLDLGVLADLKPFEGLAAEALEACRDSRLNGLCALGRDHRRALRLAMFDALAINAPAGLRERVEVCLAPAVTMEHGLPFAIGDFTDFYTSLDHALNVARAFRSANGLARTFAHMPVAYHGRVSSIWVSGGEVRRPAGQALPDGSATPTMAPTRWLDYEAELGVFVGKSNAPGVPIGIAEAQDHVFGLCLLNDWSARDIQVWESQPLGPFLSKNFATTLSPWVVTLEALAPYRVAATRPQGYLEPLPYLREMGDDGALSIDVEVFIETAAFREERRAPQRLSRTNFSRQFWTIFQMLAHHTVNGCNLQIGDLVGTGTISGPGEEEAGAMVELSEGGRRPVRLETGEQRTFLENGDTIILQAWCRRPPYQPIGFGACRATVVA